MSSLTPGVHDGVRIEYNSHRNFVDVRYPEGHAHYGIEIYNLNNFNYWALIEYVDGRYSEMSMICFPSKVWFDEWVSTAPEHRIIQQGGVLKENKS